uniref:Bestrophin homolog n=1 Tax=Panagrellus redivivus TaxID=6233 RepID=A0A7E4WCB6_PANRE
MADDDEMDMIEFDTTPVRRQNRGLLTPSIQHNNSMRMLRTNGESRQNGGAKKLKRHDTDPSMGKAHPASIRSKLSSPQSSNCMEGNDTLLNVPISRDRASPSVGSIQSDPESCIDGYFMDDDDDTMIGWFYLTLCFKNLTFKI